MCACVRACVIVGTCGRRERGGACHGAEREGRRVPWRARHQYATAPDMVMNAQALTNSMNQITPKAWMAKRTHCIA